MMKNYLTQRIKIGDIDIIGPLQAPKNYDISTLSGIINIIVSFIYPLATILLFIYLVWGGFDFLLGRGNPEKVKLGQAKITAALVGFILLMASYIIVKLIISVFGLPDSIFS